MTSHDISQTERWAPGRRRVLARLALALAGCLVVLGLLVWLHQRKERQDEPQVLAAALPSPSPTVVATRILTATATPVPEPTPPPHMAVVWNPDGRGTYLWQAPGEGILSSLVNGDLVQLTGVEATLLESLWLEVVAPGRTAWAPSGLLWKLSEPPAAYMVGEAGTYLREEPRGKVVMTVQYRTPVLEIRDRQYVKGATWSQVRLPDGTVGWLKDILLDVLP